MKARWRPVLAKDQRGAIIAGMSGGFENQPPQDFGIYRAIQFTRVFGCRP
jgi:hypothetical protein